LLLVGLMFVEYDEIVSGVVVMIGGYVVGVVVFVFIDGWEFIIEVVLVWCCFGIGI